MRKKDNGSDLVLIAIGFFLFCLAELLVYYILVGVVEA